METFVRRFVDKTIRKAEFIPTMRLGYGIILFPLNWIVLATLAGWLSPEGWGWMAAGAMWVWGEGGSRWHAWAESHMHDRRDAIDGHAFWHGSSHEAVRKAWAHYLEVVNN